MYHWQVIYNFKSNQNKFSFKYRETKNKVITPTDKKKQTIQTAYQSAKKIHVAGAEKDCEQVAIGLCVTTD